MAVVEHAQEEVYNKKKISTLVKYATSTTVTSHVGQQVDAEHVLSSVHLPAGSTSLLSNAVYVCPPGSDAAHTPNQLETLSGVESGQVTVGQTLTHFGQDPWVSDSQRPSIPQYVFQIPTKLHPTVASPSEAGLTTSTVCDFCHTMWLHHKLFLTRCANGRVTMRAHG